MTIGSRAPRPAASGGAAGVLSQIARAALRVLLGLAFRLRLEGRPPARGPYILVANHQGWADAFLVLALFPAQPRIAFVGDVHAIYGTWWKRLVATSLRVVVPIDRRSTSDRGAIERSLEVLRAGAVLGMFPEGRVSRVEANLGPLHRGAAYVAIRAQVPVVPVWLRGTAELYLGRELAIRVGEPIRPPVGPPTRAATERFTGRLEAALSGLAVPWTEPEGVRKRWRWLTDIL
jgi:1-acyl-sn-glycerol-3-phosphate acyltransferase